MATEVDKITVEEVEKLAKLARIGLTEQEKKSLSSQMTEILNYVKKLDEIETEKIDPTSQVSGLTNIVAKDGITDCAVSREDLLANAPQRENGFIKVKQVL